MKVVLTSLVACVGVALSASIGSQSVEVSANMALYSRVRVYYVDYTREYYINIILGKISMHRKFLHTFLL